MAFSIVQEAFHGEFRNSGDESPVVKLNDSFFQNIQKLSSIDEFELNFKASKNNTERVALFSKFFPSPELYLEIFVCSRVLDYAKSNSNSIQFRESGNSHFRKRDFVGALRCYNLAACFAAGKQQLSLAFANRSAVFLETGQFQLLKECLADIKLAMLNDYPEELMPKLKQRQIKCSEKMAQLTIKNPTIVANSDARTIFKENVLFHVQHPSPLIPCATTEVMISSHRIRGRELVVNKDIPAGTTLIVENPFVQILKTPLQWDFCHCQYCLQVIFGGLPCHGCIFATYCSVDCRDKAFQDYHQYECPCWPYLRLNQTPRFVLLTLRLISKLGPKGAARLFKNPQELTQLGTIYESTSYSSIHQLISHENAHSDIEHFSNVMQSLILVRLLEILTPFFTQLETDVNREIFRPWLTQLILHHLQSLPCNSLALEELKAEGLGRTFPADPESIRKAQFEQYASGVYPTVSLINHSCDPNVTRFTDSAHEGRMCIVTLKGLKAGEPLFVSYTKCFQDPLEERQEYLTDNYHFRCSCKACIENWPPLSHLKWVNQEPQFRCGFGCNETLKNGRCRSCKKKGNQTKLLLKEHNRKLEEFYKCYDQILHNQPLEVIDKLKPVLEHFQEKLIQPFGKTFQVQDALKRALDLVVYF